jgi:hypothetical protein
MKMLTSCKCEYLMPWVVYNSTSFLSASFKCGLMTYLSLFSCQQHVKLATKTVMNATEQRDSPWPIDLPMLDAVYQKKCTVGPGRNKMNRSESN